MTFQERGINSTRHVRDVTIGSWMVSQGRTGRRKEDGPDKDRHIQGKGRDRIWQEKRARAGTKWEIKL